ncbi:MAG TPA: type 4a pilus biogenesis protein PilO [Candidatus Dojkabacteria bacterium]|jgi:Tfp pilus assembly protein PilO|nr:type 4a pilus biogenesis protein PilO [Candidatus Dojkabacteria bacterium]
MDNKEPSTGLITTIKESREKTTSYITIGFTMLIVTLLIIFAIRPTITTIIKINKGIKEKESMSLLLKQRIKTLSSLNDEYEESKEKFESLSLVFPVSERYILLLSNIDSVVNRNGFKLNSISFDKYDGEGYNLSPSVLKPSIVRLSISGQYDSLINFLKDLESLPMHAVVEGIRFSIPQDGDDISFSLSLRVYNISENNFYTLK